MKAKLTLIGATIALACGAAVLVAKSRAEAPQRPAQVAMSQAAPRSAAMPRPVAPVAPDVTGVASREPRKLAAAERIATVNGNVITGRQLVAWRAGDPVELEMTAEMFASLKERAIERELTFAEAKRLGLELSAAQHAELALVRKNAEARGETDVAALEHEVTDARAHVLATMLLAREGVSPPFVTEGDLKSYRESNGGDASDTQLRERLSIEQQQQYQQQVDAYFDKLRARAQVVD